MNENLFCDREIIIGEKLMGNAEHLVMLITKPERL